MLEHANGAGPADPTARNGCNGYAPSWREPAQRPKPPHNLEAEQALLGAILVNNEAMDRVSSFLEPHHFYDPLHQQIYETAAKLIHAGKHATPITLKTFFAKHPPISRGLEVWQYLGNLVANATTIINAEDYGRLIVDLSTRRALIVIGEDVVNAVYDGSVEAPVETQLNELHRQIEILRSECSREPLSVSRCLADVEAVSIRWLWQDRIALGKLSLVAGAPGLGKSQLTCALAAAVTTGGALPDGASAPLGSAIFVTCEDDAADTIRPRLEAAGADLNRVHLFDWAIVATKEGKREKQHFDVKSHGPALVELIERIGDVRLIIIDPITAHSGRTDSHVTAEVRVALAPLQALSAEKGVAVVLISHLNKNEGSSSAINRVTGSNAYIAVCRSAWLVAPDPKDPENRRRILTPLKNNLGDDKTGFAFTIEGSELANGIQTSRISFDPMRVFVSADELLQQAKGGSEGAGSALDEAREFLRQELAEGPKPAKEVEIAAKDAGVRPRTLERARKELGVKSRKGEGKGSGWRLHLSGGSTHE